MDYQGPTPGDESWNKLTKAQKNQYFNMKADADRRSPPSATKQERTPVVGTFKDPKTGDEMHGIMGYVEPSDPKNYGR